MAGERGAEGHADRRDLVFGLHRADAEVLVLRELVQDVGRRRDRVRPQRDRELRELAGGHDAPRERGVAGDARVLAGGKLGGLDLETDADRFGRLSEVEAGEERCLVRGLDLFVAAELLGDPVEGRLDRAGVHERHEPEREEVLGTLGIAGLDPEWSADLLGEARHRNLEHAVVRQGVVVERVGRVAGLVEVAFLEGVLVDDHGAARLEAV